MVGWVDDVKKMIWRCKRKRWVDIWWKRKKHKTNVARFKKQKGRSCWLDFDQVEIEQDVSFIKSITSWWFRSTQASEKKASRAEAVLDLTRTRSEHQLTDQPIREWCGCTKNEEEKMSLCVLLLKSERVYVCAPSVFVFWAQSMPGDCHFRSLFSGAANK